MYPSGQVEELMDHFPSSCSLPVQNRILVITAIDQIKVGQTTLLRHRHAHIHVHVAI